MLIGLYEIARRIQYEHSGRAVRFGRSARDGEIAASII
jgi:hypothetical protein